jgi:hypothetical protein
MMKMKRYLKIWVACVVLLTAACTTADSLDEDYVPEEGTELIGTFFVENRQMTLRLIDITSQYDMVGYQGKAVPVQHTSFDNLPEGLKETVKNWALSAQTQVYRMKWKGEEIYHLLCLFMDENTGVFRKSGERVAFASMTEYMQFLQEASDICCILLIDVEVVRSADGAPNLLVGTWQTDWRHLHHDVGVTSSVSILMVAGLFYLGFRRLLPLLGIIVTLGLSCFFAFALGALAFVAAAVMAQAHRVLVGQVADELEETEVLFRAGAGHAPALAVFEVILVLVREGRHGRPLV